jgi:hypothetical protein
MLRLPIVNIICYSWTNCVKNPIYWILRMYSSCLPIQNQTKVPASSNARARYPLLILTDQSVFPTCLKFRDGCFGFRCSNSKHLSACRWTAWGRF